MKENKIERKKKRKKNNKKLRAFYFCVQGTSSGIDLVKKVELLVA